MHALHQDILQEIINKSGKPTQHTFLETYLGNSHQRYPIAMPVLREIAKTWTKGNENVSAKEFTALVTSLMNGESFTEKVMGGIILDYAKPDQRKINPLLFDQWLEQLEGWAEIDSLCTGKYTKSEIPQYWKKWKPFLKKLAKSKNISKRRASLVFLCQVVSHNDESEIARLALENIDLVKHEKDVLITKAISWILRSMIRRHRKLVEDYISKNQTSLPAIAVRETRIKLKTGRKG
jgi:3-methyladenine DNA glycosylase AlkD